MDHVRTLLDNPLDEAARNGGPRSGERSSWVAEVEPLWVGGVVLVTLFAAGVFCRVGLHLAGEGYEWALYLTLGSVVPALLLGLSVAGRNSRRFPGLAQTVRWALIAAGLVLSLRLVAHEHLFYIPLLVGGQLLWMQALPGAKARRLSELVIRAVVLVVVWAASVQFLFWCRFDVWLWTSRYTLAVFGLSLPLVCLSVFAGERAKPPGCDAVAWVANLDGVLLLAVLSLRSDVLFESLTFHHWGVFVGPAALVRQGGWLLWDVASQYGFLSILSVALVPGRTTWESMFMLNALLIFLSGMLLFVVLRAPRRGYVNFPFALATTVAAVCLLPGLPKMIKGPQLLPSIGMFRFFWAYALLAILYWGHRSGRDGERHALLVGCAAWLVGTLWSVESAAYCAAVWLPAYVLIVLRRAAEVRAAGGGGRAWCVFALRWLLLPPVLLAGAVGGITAYYLAYLGHGPDWLGFCEYALGFVGGVMSLPIDPQGPVWALLGAYCVLATVVVYFLRQGLWHAGLPLAVGAWAALWVTSSYFVARSEASNATSQSVVIVLGIGLALQLLRRADAGDAWARVVRMCCVPFLTVILSAAFGNTAAPAIPGSMRLAVHPSAIARQVPVVEPALLDLFRAAGVQPGDPMISSGWNLIGAWPAGATAGGPVESAAPAWLPARPSALFLHLSPSRRMTYFSRFAERARRGGWLAEPKDDEQRTWSAQELARTHKATRTFENAVWRLTWFDYVGPDRG